ncbi:ATP-binding protein [Streptomyces sp. ISL-66]|uniref:ATP-binding protein n=1 Tax=Streptomyces sp. ISL-66 TaxID=2819186 RepID=UPI0027E44E25|nr:ATP-binding protein [Streptomyces sp. ISL-66]
MNVEIHPALLRERFYPRSRQSVRSVREFAAVTLHAWGVTCRRDDVLLCVSELATNALLHGIPPGRGYRVRLVRFGDVVRVEVHDSGGGRPRVEDRDPGAERGRGLLLVAAVADRWGVGVRVPGKVVWCEFAVGAAGAARRTQVEPSACAGPREPGPFRDGAGSTLVPTAVDARRGD